MITKPEKYTREFVLSELRSMIAETLGNGGLFYKGQLFENRDYSPSRLSEWATKFEKDDEISEAIDKLDQIFLGRAVVGGLGNKLSPVMTKFHLINNYGWRDKQEIDHTTRGQSINALDSMSDEAREKMRLIYEEEMRKKVTGKQDT